MIKCLRTTHLFAQGEKQPQGKVRGRATGGDQEAADDAGGGDG